MAAPIECSTEDKLEYQFHENASGYVQFRVRAANDAHVALTQGPQESDPMYEVFIGGWGNTKSVIRRDRSKPDKVEVETPGVLNGGEFRGFWVRWTPAGDIQCGREGESEPFLQWTDPDPVTSSIRYVGVCTGWGATGSWMIEPARVTPSGGGGGVSGQWLPADGGHVPEGCQPHGEDAGGEPVWVARAHHESGALLPGKLVPSHGCCYVPWGGAEHACSQYEVLAGDAVWVASRGGEAPPPGAVRAGNSEDGEPLYVGRVRHEGALTPGKVQPSHAACYIPWGGEEMPFPEYEILVIP